MQGLVAFLRGLGAARLTAMVAVTAALIGFFGFVIMRVSAPQMTTLFTDLSGDDSSGIIKDLERQGIPFELRNDGAVILVPKEKVTRLRMKHELRPEHQSSPRAGGRTRPHHPRYRPHPGRARPSGAARAAAFRA